MKKIYAPWREKYVVRAAHKTNKERMEQDCVFCEQIKEDDDETNLILKRFKNTFVMFNLYPYNGGHLMVLPNKHWGTLDECPEEVRAELMESVTKSVEIIKKELTPQGFNIGLNMGEAGGGGIPSHLHIHIVPRWEGDTNFLPVIARAKTISVDLQKLYARLKSAFDES